MIGDDIVVTVVDIKGDNVRLSIDAPRSVKIYRAELYEAIIAENKQAALSADLTGLDSLTSSIQKEETTKK
ncbi:MAG: carbon storage regulator CsrA [Firmicutes bacterium]|nr:carbon storage regulator CsrA [Bacillota bacterium]